MYSIAAPGSASSVFGFLGSGGLAVCLTLWLIFGVIGKGKVQLTTFKAGLSAFATGASYNAAGKIWSSPQQVVDQGWTGFGVGGGPGAFGEIGIGAACLALFILMLVAPLNPVRAAILYLVASFTWPSAGVGSIWDIPSQFTAALFLIFGA
ncbi:hypothetical protein AB0G48_20850 [Streptomyces rubiginosohelvolus]|uniref:hypothetical protein n=1 Tax=Streptomyces rubiginosohelvolus TaxID=67362 RepID=UPI0033EF8734